MYYSKLFSPILFKPVSVPSEGRFNRVFFEIKNVFEALFVTLSSGLPMKSILTLFLVLMRLMAYLQPFTILIKDSLTDDVINTAAELPDGNLLLAGIKQDQILCNALLYEVDPYGTPIRSKIFNHNGQISGIDNLILTDYFLEG